MIVIDNPVAIARLQRLIQEIDQEVPLLKIRMRYESADSDRGSEARASARITSGKTSVEMGPGPGPKEEGAARLATGQDQARRQSEYMIRVRSGSVAYIETGYDVAQREGWRELSRRYGYISDTVTFHQVDSGFHIRPVLQGDQVRIEIIPRIHYVDNRGYQQNIQFAEAATTLFTPLEKWIDIGGIMGGHREINRQILSDSRHATDNRLSMRLMVTID